MMTQLLIQIMTIMKTNLNIMMMAMIMIIMVIMIMIWSRNLEVGIRISNLKKTTWKSSKHLSPMTMLQVKLKCHSYSYCKIYKMNRKARKKNQEDKSSTYFFCQNAIWSWIEKNKSVSLPNKFYQSGGWIFTHNFSHHFAKFRIFNCHFVFKRELDDFLAPKRNLQIKAGQNNKYRISANSFSGSYFFLEVEVRKLFKGGNYWFFLVFCRNT